MISKSSKEAKKMSETAPEASFEAEEGEEASLVIKGVINSGYIFNVYREKC